MATVKYYAKENKKVGTHSFFAVPKFAGKLSFNELCEEACEDNTFSVEEMTGCVRRFMKTIQREAGRGFRCEVGEDFLTVYPNISMSVKDYTDKETGQLVVATAEMVKAQYAKSRLGCTVSPKFSALFANAVTWKKVDANGNEVSEEEEEDITQGNGNVEGGTDDNQGGGDNSGGDDNGGGEHSLGD